MRQQQRALLLSEEAESSLQKHGLLSNPPEHSLETPDTASKTA
jgi:hypothetical protein